MEVDALDAVAPREKPALVEQDISISSVAATRYAYIDFQEHRSRGRGSKCGTFVSQRCVQDAHFFVVFMSGTLEVRLMRGEEVQCRGTGLCGKLQKLTPFSEVLEDKPVAGCSMSNGTKFDAP